MSLVEQWNLTISNVWPFSEILSRLNIECLPMDVPLFTLEDIREISALHPVGWRKIASTISLLIIARDIPLPQNPDQFVDYVLVIIQKIERDSEDVEWYSESIYELSKDPRKRIPLKGVVGLLDQLFTFRYKHPQELPSDYYDIDLKSYIPTEVERPFRSELLRIVGQDPFNFRRYFVLNTPFSYEEDGMLAGILEWTRTGRKYANLDSKRPISQHRAARMKCVNNKLRICSDREDVFEFISRIAWRFRPGSPLRNSEVDLKNSTRYQVWHRDFKTLDGTCYCCSSLISITDWYPGYMVSLPHGGGVENSNIRPVCRQCYDKIGSRNLDDYMEEFGLKRSEAPISPRTPRQKSLRKIRRRKIKR